MFSLQDVTTFCDKSRMLPALLCLSNGQGHHYMICSSLTKFDFFSCPEQLNRWPCHWLTHWLTQGTLPIDIQRATHETCDLWDLWSEWWGYMTWPKKRQWQRQIQRQRQRQWQWQRHLEKTLKERPKRPVTFDTFYQSDEETRPVQQKDNVKDI